MKWENRLDLRGCKTQCTNLPDGKTCNDCLYVKFCILVFGVKPENTSCDFEPIRFKQKGA